MGILGIDISNNNPNVNMAQAKAQGVRFVIAKCSQGWAGGPGGWMDWTWVDIVNRTRAAGMLPGGYHWALKGNGALQAQQFVASLNRAGGPKGFLCAIDIERNDWNQALNVDVATVDAFLVEWDRLTGRQPILLYGACWYHDDYMHAGARWPTRPLWWAGYTTVGVMPIEQAVASVTPNYMSPFGGWTNYALRQFTSNAMVGGVQCDANVTYLSDAQLLALTQPPTAPSTGEFVMDAAATKAFAALTKQVSDLGAQLTTVIQGVPKGTANPYGIIGHRDLSTRLAALEAAVTKLAAAEASEVHDVV